jgi:hypothetical protein
MGGGGGMGGMGGGFRSMPPHEQLGGFTGPQAKVPASETNIRVRVADVTLAIGKGSKVDVLEALADEEPEPGAPAAPKVFTWDRQFVAKDGSGIMALETAWDTPGPAPFRWLWGGNSNQSPVGDTLASWMIGQPGQSTIQDTALDPFDPRPENLLDLAGATTLILKPNYARAEVVGIDLIDGQEAVRVAWISSQWGIRGLCWFVPKLGFALARFEATRDPFLNEVPTYGRMTWRKQASEFARVGNHWLPGKIAYDETQANPTEGGEPVYRHELRAAFETVKIDPANPPASAFHPKLAIQGLDDKTGQFAALPPELPAGLLDRLKKAAQESPFGPPGDGTTPPPKPVGQPQFLPLIDPAPVQPQKIQKDDAKADPGIIAQPKPGFEDPIPVSKPRIEDPMPIKNPRAEIAPKAEPNPARPADPEVEIENPEVEIDKEIQAAIDREVKRMFKADPEVVKLAEELRRAEQKLEEAQRNAANNPDDPEVKAARSSIGQLSSAYADLWSLKSRMLREPASKKPAIVQAESELVGLLYRRLKVVDELKLAEAQRNAAQAILNVKLAQAQDQPDERKALLQSENELPKAKATVALKKSELAKLDELVKEVKSRLLEDKVATDVPVEKAEPLKAAEDQKAAASPLASPKPATEPKVDPIQKSATVDQALVSRLAARRRGKAAEVQKAEAQKAIAQAVVARNEKLIQKDKNYVSTEEKTRAEKELALAEAELELKKADLAEAEILLANARQPGLPALEVPRPGTTTATPSNASLGELRDAVELIEVQLLGKRSELKGAESKADLANKVLQQVKKMARQQVGSLEAANQEEDRFKLSQADLEQKRIEVQEYEIRLKQARRRVEAEEARLKREVERARQQLSKSEEMQRQGFIGIDKVNTDRDAYDDLMRQLDPKYVPRVTVQ